MYSRMERKALRWDSFRSRSGERSGRGRECRSINSSRKSTLPPFQTGLFQSPDSTPDCRYPPGNRPDADVRGPRVIPVKDACAIWPAAARWPTVLAVDKFLNRDVASGPVLQMRAFNNPIRRGTRWRPVRLLSKCRELDSFRLNANSAASPGAQRSYEVCPSRGPIRRPSSGNGCRANSRMPEAQRRRSSGHATRKVSGRSTARNTPPTMASQGVAFK